MPKISVIVPAYNVEDKIDRCLSSLANQTFKDIEFIVINDGSKDKTYDIMKKYKKDYPEKFKIVSRENRGISETRNEGISLAAGDYIGFVDSDDYIELDMYEKLYFKIKETKSDIVFCDYYELRGNDKKIKEVGDKNFEGNLFENPELFTQIYYAPWNKLYKKDLFNNIEFPVGVKYEDLETILKVFSKADKIVKLDCPLYNYVLNPNGETSTVNEKVFDILIILNNLIEYFKKYKKNIKFYSEFEKLVVEALFSYVNLLFKENKFNYDFIYDFYIKAITIINKNFKNWKLKYIFRANNAKDLIMRFMHCNKHIYYKFLNKKRKLKKEILFTGFTLQTGGVSKALINLINNIDYSKYSVTVILQVKGQNLLNQINNNVKIMDYNLSKKGNKIIKKFINILKYIYILLKNKNKYDFAGCFEPGYPLSSILALNSSKNNAVWMHTNILKYMEFSNWFSETPDITLRAKKFIDRMYFRNFKRNLFVSKNSLDAYLKIYPMDKNKCFVCYNFIDYASIKKMSKEKIELSRDKHYTFLNVSRHTEFDKRISLIIEASKKLKEEKLKFKVILVGDGTDHQMYKELISKYNLDDNIYLLGSKLNPFPYYKISDAFILTSNFEGYPVVFNESLVMNIPIISTDVSDAKKDIDNKFGLVLKKATIDEVYMAMKKFIIENYKIEKAFDPQKFNDNSMKLIERMIENEI